MTREHYKTDTLSRTRRSTLTGCEKAARLAVWTLCIAMTLSVDAGRPAASVVLAEQSAPASSTEPASAPEPASEVQPDWLGGSIPAVSQSSPAAKVPVVAATAYCVLDSVTGRILFEKNAHQRRSPASTTKIMTGLLVLEKADLEAKVKVSKNAATTRGSTMWLSAAEELTVKDLLYGLLLNSGNDAAVALAEHVSGSVEKFAELMTERARQLGAVSTQFKNPHGLDEEGHYTTAYDLSLIARAAMSNSQFASIVGTRRQVVPWPGHSQDRALHSHNRFLWQYQGATGVKTGYTSQAGKCLVASAFRDGWQVIATVLSSSKMYTDASALMNAAFQNYKLTTVVQKGDVVGSVQVQRGQTGEVQLVAARELVVPLNEAEQSQLEQVRRVADRVAAPVAAGSVLGSIVTKLNGTEMGTVEVVAAEDIRAANVVQLFVGKLWGLFSGMFKGRGRT